MGTKIKFIFSAILAYGFILFSIITAEPVEDKRALLDFIRNIEHSRDLKWHESTSVCSSWTGVTCSSDNSRVIFVRLPAIGLVGSIPPNTLGRLSALQILSLRSNGITGPFPDELLGLENLTGLFLQFNNFQGPLPSNFPVWRNLSLLDLSNNEFNGSIPFSVANLTSLASLNLANNSLSGDIPDFDIHGLKMLDLSNNNLTGAVPRSLLRFPNSAFLGNNISLPPSPSPSPNVIPKKHSSKISESTILGIVIGTCVLAFMASALLLLFTYRNRRGDKRGGEIGNKSASKLPKQDNSFKNDNQNGNSGLVFFDGNNLLFDLEDLLRASAEVLGKGTFGTTYKAALEDTTIVTVKRLKEVNAGRKDFEHQMDIIGRIRHENVNPLRAYYCSKDEKLIVYDYCSQGSLSTLLHAKRGEQRIPLDWETRLNIAKGAAKGISHIHSQNGGKFVHGNIKASNIFLNSQQYGCVSDIGLAILMNPITSPISMTNGYRAPEVTNTRKVSQPSDIYSFGVVLLELLSGKSPVATPYGDEVIQLVRWVNLVVREEWTGEVFDLELLAYPKIEEEMVAMLQIGLICVSRMPEQRPKMVEVVQMLEDITNVNKGSSISGETRSYASTPAPTPPSVLS